jgi:nucleoside recognition membrane protein YjiH
MLCISCAVNFYSTGGLTRSRWLLAVFANYRSGPHFGATFSKVHKGYVFISTKKKGLGHILMNFFTSSSGRPGLQQKKSTIFAT